MQTKKIASGKLYCFFFFLERLFHILLNEKNKKSVFNHRNFDLYKNVSTVIFVLTRTTFFLQTRFNFQCLLT